MFKVNLTVNIKTEGNFVDGANASLICDFSDMGIYEIQNVTWYRNGHALVTADDIAKINVTLSNNGKIIYFPSLSHSLHIAIYTCYVTLSNGYQIQNANNNFELLIPCMFKLSDYRAKCNFKFCLF